MTTFPKLTQSGRALVAKATSGLGQQAMMLAVLIALFLIIPLAIENAPLGVRLGVLAVVLPLITVWVVSTPVHQAKGADGSLSLEQLLRWGQYVAIVVGLLWMREILQ